MRFIHTADWHLGRVLHSVRLTADQEHLLEQFHDLVEQERPDAVLVAGDVYDRSVPPTEAVELLDDALQRLVLRLQVPVVLIAGNHDSAQRLAFGGGLLCRQGLHVVGPLGSRHVVTLHDADGPVHIHPVPYAEPAVVREHLANGELRDHDAAMRALTDSIRQGAADGRHVLLGHAFVTGGEQSESERPLSIGGSGAVDAACFEGFDYVALGHLHRPQTAGGPRVHYAGSLMKYSFSEVAHRKCVKLVEMDESGGCEVQQICLTPRRDVRRLEGTLAEVLAGAAADPAPEDYLLVSLTDRGPILDAMGKLREVYPNVLHIERPHLTAATPGSGRTGDHRSMTERELFETFWQQVQGEKLTDAEADAFASVVDQLRQREREAAG